MAEMLSDDIFEQYAAQQEQEAKLASSNKGSGNFNREYESLKYTGLETGKATVVRVIGGPPNINLTPYDCRTVLISRIIDDDGRQMRVIRPADDNNYIINRIIARVKATKWVNNVKTCPVQESDPDIYNLIDKNGLDPSDKRAKFDKGWSGKEVLMMNVIDRSQMDWHKANKHTMMLAKSITESNGIEYVDEGVSAYAISQRLNHLFKSYGSWEKYDIAITKTGEMNNPYILVNASNSPKEVDAAVRDFVSTEDHLTDEEKSWEQYNLENLFRVTTNTKIYNRLKNTIKRIDKALGTDFLRDLEGEVEREKKLFEELYKDEDKTAAKPAVSNTPVKEEYHLPETVVANTNVPEAHFEEAKPAARTRTTASSSKPGSDLPYYDTLSDDLKSKIISATKGADGKWDIKWDLPVDQLASCPGGGPGDVNHNCSTVAPLDCTCCPVCGLSFI